MISVPLISHNLETSNRRRARAKGSNIPSWILFALLSGTICQGSGKDFNAFSELSAQIPDPDIRAIPKVPQHFFPPGACPTPAASPHVSDRLTVTPTPTFDVAGQGAGP